MGQQLHGDGSRSTAGYDAADITHHIIADGADPLRVAQQRNGFLGAGNLPGRHGMERLFIRRGHRHTDNIKNNTDQNDKKQKTVTSCTKSKVKGLCSCERSMIHPDYARNWICDFILGKSQPEIDPCLF